MTYEDLIFTTTLFLAILLGLLETHAFVRRRGGRGGARPT
jgi:hypothetical protein